MTSLVAPITDLTFDSNDVQNIPGIFLELVEGAFDGLELRGEDDVLLGTEGRFPRNRVRDYRMLRLAGFVSAGGVDEASQRSTFTNHMDNLRGWFDPRFVGTLSALFPDGTTRVINARPSPPKVNQIVPAMALVSIVLEAVGPTEWEVTEAGS